MGGGKGIRPVKKLSGGVLAWLSVWARCRFAYGPIGPADTTTTYYRLLQQIHIGFTFLVLPFWYWLTRVVPDKV